jgi:hypothetical protein
MGARISATGSSHHSDYYPLGTAGHWVAMQLQTSGGYSTADCGWSARKLLNQICLSVTQEGHTVRNIIQHSRDVLSTPSLRLPSFHSQDKMHVYAHQLWQLIAILITGFTQFSCHRSKSWHRLVCIVSFPVNSPNIDFKRTKSQTQISTR